MNEDELDRMCVERCLRGDPGAFDGIVGRYERPVYNAIVRFGVEREDARDLAQQVFLKAYERLDTYDATRKFFSWIYRIAVNETLNYLKALHALEPLRDDVQDARLDPQQELEEAEEEAEVQRALLQLDPKYRLAIIVRHFLHLSYEEAAEVLSVPAKTVKSRLFTARQLLKEIIEGRRHVVR